MSEITTRLRIASRRLALLLGALGLAFGAMPASAQICGELDEVANETLDAYLDLLDEEFDVDLNDPELCDSFTKTFIKGCQTAVKDTGKCILNQISNLTKLAETACKGLAGPFASECAQDYKDDLKLAKSAIQAEVQGQSEDCGQILAEDFWDVCMFGF